MPALPRHLPSNPKELLICQSPNHSVLSKNLQLITTAMVAREHFLIIVDCFTDWPEVIPMGQNTQTQHIIAAIRQTFCHTAVPDICWLDEGAQFIHLITA